MAGRIAKVVAFVGLILLGVTISQSTIATNATPVAMVTAEPTPDSTTVTLTQEKLRAEVEQLQKQNKRDWLWTNGSALVQAVTTAGAGIIVGLFAVYRWSKDRQDALSAREREDDRWLRDREEERSTRTAERFRVTVEQLGSGSDTVKIGATTTLLTFLQPGYGDYYAQVCNLASAGLRLVELPPLSATDAYPARFSQTPLASALTTVFVRAFPLARDYLMAETAVREENERAETVGPHVPENARAVTQQLAARLDNRRVGLRGAILYQAELRHGWLIGADLVRASLTSANLEYAMLRDADLRAASLNGAKCKGANLRSADLRGVNLMGADLSETDLRGAKMDGARGLAAVGSLELAYMVGVTGLSDEERAICESKGAIFDQLELALSPVQTGTWINARLDQNESVPHSR